MIELMIDRWTLPDGSIRYLWSVWRSGKRIGLGEGAPTSEDAETAGRLWCQTNLAHAPDRVTRL